jgi:hypothetical protein
MADEKVYINESGYLVGVLPEECVKDCSHSGACGADVEAWTEELGFIVPRKIAIKYLLEYGAWDEEELVSKTDTELAHICLWIGCGNESENGPGSWGGCIH